MNGQGIAQFIPLILIFVIFYFFLIRPQQKRAKDHLAMVAGLKRGDEVITSGGIIGTVDLQSQACLKKQKLNNNFFCA
jgi:preprotein translocase subunit YajC